MKSLAVLLRSTPLRLTIAISLLFVIVGAASFLATWLYLLQNTRSTLSEGLEQQMQTYAALPDREVLITAIRNAARRTSPEYRLLSYTAPDGRTAGHLSLAPMGEGFAPINFGKGHRKLAIDHELDDVEGLYLALSRRMHGGTLTIATNANELDDTGEALLSVALFSLIPTALLAIASGVYIAVRSRRNLARIENTLSELTAGQLDARVDSAAWRQQDLKRIGERIDRMAAAQQQQTSALKQVSADIAHDLKTPIQRVAVTLTQLDDDPSLSASARTLLDKARNETDHIVQTFQSLLLLAQVEGGSARQRFSAVDLGALLHTFHELYEAAAEESGHRLQIQRELSPIFVQGERTLLGQLLANLIENALRHTPPGSTITLDVDTPTPTSAVIEVADDGPGIPANERENVLTRLYRLEQSRTTPGNGLGLSIAAAVAELHEGVLTLEDNVPGLRVRVTLPRTKPG